MNNFYKKISKLFLFLFIFSIFNTVNAQTWTTIQQNNVQVNNTNQQNSNQDDIFSDASKTNTNWLNKILKPRFQFQLVDEKWKIVKTPTKEDKVEVWFLDWKKQRIWFCELNLNNWLCELDLRNKSIEWTSWFFWILFWWRSIWTLIPFDFELEKNSQLEIWSSNVVHWFANVKIILKSWTNYTWYEYWSMQVIPVWWNETSNNQIDIWDSTYNQEIVKWKIDISWASWVVKLITDEWVEVSEPFYIKLDENWNSSWDFEIKFKKSNFELWKNYSLVFYPNESQIMRTWKTVRYVWEFTEFKSQFDWIVLNVNKKYSTTIEPKTPIIKIWIIILLCWLVVVIMDKFFIRWMNYLRWDKSQIWIISNKKPPFNF